MRMMRAQEIHDAVHWPDILARLGIDPEALTNRHGPCPACGGTDRFRFDDKDGRGTFICSQGGGGVIAGDGFRLLEHCFGWSYKTAREHVVGVIGGQAPTPAPATPPTKPKPRHDEPAQPSRRAWDILRTAAPPDSVEDLRAYLASRGCWPLPDGCELRGHAGVDYFDENRARVGRYPALLAPVRDIFGELVTVHRTYLQNGRKIDGYKPRKLLSPVRGRRGCAVRLAAIEDDTLGIAEGIESGLAAMRLHGVPTWAALSAPVLEKFEPPQGIHRVVAYADGDRAGFEAAWKLRDRLEGQAVVELALPPAPHNDWADVLAARGGAP